MSHNGAFEVAGGIRTGVYLGAGACVTIGSGEVFCDRSAVFTLNGPDGRRTWARRGRVLFSRPWLLVAGLLLVPVLVFGGIWGANAVIIGHAQGRTFDSLAKVQARPVALVLGTAPKLADGRPNLYFEYRIDAAVQLFAAGKIQAILVSGDNGTRGYDEPTAFQSRLIERGVPESKIFLDYAGFRTLDSVVRAREVFGQSQLIVVSQKFHNERAIYLAEHRGVDLIGYNAQDVSGRNGLKTKLREYLARCKVFVDLWLGVEPKFLGEKVQIL